jgi:hypothetical protein
MYHFIGSTVLGALGFQRPYFFFDSQLQRCYGG